jgi:hypothetical protein
MLFVKSRHVSTGKLNMNESPSLANQSPQFQGFLPAWCLLLAVAMSILVWGDGWYAGFFSAQSVSGVLPPWFWGALTTLGDERMLLALLLPFSLRFPRVFWAIVIASLLAARCSLRCLFAG